MITFPNNTVEIIDQIRNAIGRPVTFQFTVSGVVCPTCGVNPYTDTGVDPFCPTCSGIGYIYLFDYVTITGHVTWGHNDLPNWVTGGQYFTGDCVVQVKYTDYTKDILEKTEYVYVDGMKMRITSKILRGVPGINRILLDLKQED
ncbi:MAG: hypothetical protein QXV73_05395 [Candidatus Micrarchaeia archaeon]